MVLESTIICIGKIQWKIMPKAKSKFRQLGVLEKWRLKPNATLGAAWCSKLHWFVSFESLFFLFQFSSQQNPWQPRERGWHHYNVGQFRPMLVDSGNGKAELGNVSSSAGKHNQPQHFNPRGTAGVETSHEQAPQTTHCAVPLFAPWEVSGAVILPIRDKPWPECSLARESS